MEPLAPLIIQLITQVGIPAASKIVALWHTQAPDTVGLGEWRALLELLAITPDDAIAIAIRHSGSSTGISS